MLKIGRVVWADSWAQVATNSQLVDIWDCVRYVGSLRLQEQSHSNGEHQMAPNRRTVGPSIGGGWQVTGGSKAGHAETQQAGIDRARRELVQTGGGELLIKGRDGRVRDQNTIDHHDPEKTKG